MNTKTTKDSSQAAHVTNAAHATRAAHAGKRPVSGEQPGPIAGKYVLRLFVAGATARSRQAILRVRQICETELKDRCDFEVIDIYQQPRLARLNQIVATPTLVKEFPKPMRRFIGNLLNTVGLFAELDVNASARAEAAV